MKRLTTMVVAAVCSTTLTGCTGLAGVAALGGIGSGDGRTAAKGAGAGGLLADLLLGREDEGERPTADEEPAEVETSGSGDALPALIAWGCGTAGGPSHGAGGASLWTVDWVRLCRGDEECRWIELEAIRERTRAPVYATQEACHRAARACVADYGDGKTRVEAVACTPGGRNR